jgi:transcriptional regulator with GAF, ATPase, and Fis domain
MARRLVDLVVAVLPVTSAGLVLVDDGGEQSFYSGPDHHPLPNTILRRVIGERLSICTDDILSDRLFDPSASMITSAIRAVIAVPVVAEDTLIAVLHGTAHSVRFDSAHLQLMTGIAGAAASSLAAALRVQRLERQNKVLQEQIRKEASMVGDSAALKALHSLIARIAPSSSTVLIIGESGTGKELVASAIHRNSPRAARAFIAINCAALTETLLEKRIIRSREGSFTGAVAQKRGKFEEANGGTIFLDEIGELAQGMQAKLLRVLAGAHGDAVGGNHDLRVDVRVIAATNRDLAEMVRAGRFREDLYFRLNVIAIRTPARARPSGGYPSLGGALHSESTPGARRAGSPTSRRALCASGPVRVAR